ncbi:MAG TPA: hypothetical protein VFG20_10060 [Planctomycetaceae bacterium]|nr:hypothetical protein [Planctomycetaceae bacterium]
MTLRERTGLALPAIDDCEVLVLADDWDDVEVAIAAESTLVWYHWWTTA